MVWISQQSCYGQGSVDQR